MIAHPFTAKVPETSQSDYAALREGIRTKGQIYPIIIKDGVIWDGRNREAICQELGIAARYEEYSGSLTAPEYILQASLRRNLTPTQRDAMIIALAREVVPQMREKTKQARINGGLRGSEEAIKVRTKDSVTPLPENTGKGSNRSPGHTQDRFRKLVGHYQKADDTLAVLNHDDLATKVEQGALSLRAAAKEAVTRNKAKRQQNRTKEAPKRYERPAPMKFPSPEETGFPVNGTMAEKDAHHRKYGRTPLFPKEVRDMLNNQAIVEMYVTSILSASSDVQPSPEAFFEALDQLLAWIPKPDKGQDYAINFAAKAKKSLALFEARLPLAVERLRKLSELLQARHQSQ